MAIVELSDQTVDTRHSAVILRTPDSNRLRITRHSLAVSSVAAANHGQTAIFPVNVPPDSFLNPPAFVSPIQKAIDEGNRVINISLVFPRVLSEKLKTLALENPRIVLVVAAGNDRLTGPAFRSELEPLLGIGNVLIVANAADKTSLGRTSNAGTHAAIGEQVPVAVWTDDHDQMSGTSLSSPRVSRTANQMFAADPGLMGEQVVRIIDETTENSTGTIQNDVSAGGTINEHDAVTVAAITGLMRNGVPFDIAAQHLRVPPSKIKKFQAIALSILPSPSPDRLNRQTLDFMNQKYKLDSTEKDLLRRVIFGSMTLEEAASSLRLTPDSEVVLQFLRHLGIAPQPNAESVVRTLFNRDRIRAAKSN